MTPAARRWDREALGAGAALAVVVAVPFAVLGRWAADDASSGLVVVANLGMIGGLGLGAACAAWRQALGAPLSHGIATALGVYAAIQLCVVAVRLVRDADVGWAQILFNTTLAAFVGLLGGLAGEAMRGRILPAERPDRRGGTGRERT